MEKPLLEVCVDTVESFEAAIKGGAGRIELCSALEMGGLTPTPGLIEFAKRAPIPVYAMIRPRAGHFHFSDDEIRLMVHEIEMVRYAGLAGVVLGVSKPDDTLHEEALKTLVMAAGWVGKTLHRVFDLVPDFHAALETATTLGFERILTSGGRKTAVEGTSVLKILVRRAGSRLSVMPGAGVTAENASSILAATGATEIHASCRIEAPIKASKKQIMLGYGENLKEATVESVSGLINAIAQTETQ